MHNGGIWKIIIIYDTDNFVAVRIVLCCNYVSTILDLIMRVLICLFMFYEFKYEPKGL